MDLASLQTQTDFWPFFDNAKQKPEAHLCSQARTWQEPENLCKILQDLYEYFGLQRFLRILKDSYTDLERSL